MAKNIKPPKFVMWKSIPRGENLGWQRQWFGSELQPKSFFNVRGIGIMEPMFNADVFRPIGTGDWLIMFFHKPARLDCDSPKASVAANTLVLWPPGAKQFYSWGAAANVEPHSWMHVEGTWVEQQIEENRIPNAEPIQIEEETLMLSSLQDLMNEMTRDEEPDQIILQNLFQNWARGIARCLGNSGSKSLTPDWLLKVRGYLDDHFTETTPLDELASLADVSRSHLCHQFREHVGTTISGYVIRQRMTLAQRLLFDMNLRPGEIAMEVGYADIYQFSKQFKKYFGVSPTGYRKRHAGG